MLHSLIRPSWQTNTKITYQHRHIRQTTFECEKRAHEGRTSIDGINIASIMLSVDAQTTACLNHTILFSVAHTHTHAHSLTCRHYRARNSEKESMEPVGVFRIILTHSLSRPLSFPQSMALFLSI